MNTELVKISRTQKTEQGSLLPEDKEKLARAARIIRSGGLVIFPTETVYGLGGDATNPEAARKIYSAKGRPSDNPLIIHVSTPEDAEKYAYTCDVYYDLARKFMPGPLTVIMKAKDTVPKETRGGLDTVAVRCPVDPIAREFIELCGVAVAAPSANLSGSPSPTVPSHVIDDMMGRVDMIIDGGECEFGLESTIVKIEDDGTLCLLRPGKITFEELSEIAVTKIADAVTDKLKEGEKALSPGMKYRHYAPKAALVLLDGNLEECLNYIDKSEQINKAVICYTDEESAFSSRLPSVSVFALGARGDEVAQAHSLFKVLRDVDRLNFDIIFAPLPEKRGIGLALYNRLIRASAHTIINLRR